MTLSSAVGSALATFGFYVLARMMGNLLGMAGAGLYANVVLTKVLKLGAATISLVIPRLDLMAQSSWLVYGPDTIGIVFILVQGLVFTGVVLLASLVDFSRRQF